MSLEALNATDTNMWYDQTTNRCNVMASLIFDKCDESVIREVFQNKMPQDRFRLRAKLVKILDNYYFKELPKEEARR